MKLNITVDIDWIEEDGSIDEEVKHQIIQGVKNSIGKTCLDKVEKQASKAIDEAINKSVASAGELINGKAIAFANEWLGKKVEVTDQWGEVVKECTIEELVKDSFSDTLNKRVDSKGEFCGTSGYRGNMSMLEFITGKNVKEVVATELKGFKKDIDQKIKAAINEGIKNNVSDAFAEMIVGVAKSRHKDSQAITQQEG